MATLWILVVLIEIHWNFKDIENHEIVYPVYNFCIILNFRSKDVRFFFRLIFEKDKYKSWCWLQKESQVYQVINAFMH